MPNKFGAILSSRHSLPKLQRFRYIYDFLYLRAHSSIGKVKCVPNIWKPIPRMCRGKAPNTSYCAGNSVYECPTGELFRCPSDMKCQKRGLRAYCIPPMAHENPEKLCDNFAEPEKASVCDAYNLKKITSCANGTVSLCPSGQMCDNDNPQAPTTAACKPYESNPNRWCSNKPLMSSFCVPRSEKALLILCSSTPHIFECPTGKCVQELGITAKCIQ